jgi:hypothetical protein
MVSAAADLLAVVLVHAVSDEAGCQDKQTCHYSGSEYGTGLLLQGAP